MNQPAWETRTPPWEWSTVSTLALGDQGPWVWSLPFCWQAMADPEGPWQAPTRPAVDREAGDLLGPRIAYWTPLLTLTLGALGWVRPDLGARRWLDQGRPAPDGQAALRVLDRWWADDVGALEEWSAFGPALPSYATQVNDAVGGRPMRDWRPDRVERPRWVEVSTGGHDSLHLGHILGHLTDDHGRGRIVHGHPTGALSAVVLLDTYSGWYAALARLGATLPVRTDGRSWRVDVVVRPIGWLGTYRQSRVTGRWFTGRHRWHELGWNGPGE